MLRPMKMRNVHINIVFCVKKSLVNEQNMIFIIVLSVIFSDLRNKELAAMPTALDGVTEEYFLCSVAW